MNSSNYIGERYQGKTAKKFVQHAISFDPQYLFLILPNMKWTPSNYEIIYMEELPENAFYDSITGKNYKEICTTFKIFKKIDKLENGTVME